MVPGITSQGLEEKESCLRLVLKSHFFLRQLLVSKVLMRELKNLKKINSKMRSRGIIKNDSAVMLTRLYLPEWQKIL